MKKKAKQKRETKTHFRYVFKIALIVLVFVMFFFSGDYAYNCLIQKVCNHEVIEKRIRKDMTVLLPKGFVSVEVVDTKVSRSLGLSGRPPLKEGEGMLFVFADPGKYGFWMKGMNFPLDIIWISENGIVVHTEKNITPDSYPETFINTIDATYVLEIQGGMSHSYGIHMGSKIVFDKE
jgi:uncharacterized membrane protein (UPF0127 family)